MQEKGLKALTSVVNLGSATSRDKFRSVTKAYKRRATRFFLAVPFAFQEMLYERNILRSMLKFTGLRVSFYTYACGNFVWASFVMKRAAIGGSEKGNLHLHDCSAPQRYHK